MMSETGRRTLIITADDFGYDRDRNRGIVECYRNGAVTRTTLLVNGRASMEASQLAKSYQIPLGLHLNLTEGKPISKPQEIQSLLSEDGYFLGKHGFREALQSGMVRLEEVKKEIEAQIICFKSLMDDLSPGHVDGHQHAHVLPGISKTLADVLSHHGINSVRLPVELGLKNCTWLPQPAMDFYKSVVAQSLEAGDCFTSNGINFPDAFLGMTVMGNYMNTTRLQQEILDCFSRPSIKKSSSGSCHTAHPDEMFNSSRHSDLTCELMVHPGYPCRNPEEGGCGGGADEFATSNEREHEMRVLGSDEMKQFYKKFNIVLSS